MDEGRGASRRDGEPFPLYGSGRKWARVFSIKSTPEGGNGGCNVNIVMFDGRASKKPKEINARN